MTTTSQPWTEETLDVAGSRLKVLKGGSGKPLLVFHDEMGHPGWLQYHQALARDHTVYIPLHPGFGESPQLDWVMSMHDLALWYLGALDDLKLEGTKVLGFSLGGWLAAEMAVMCPQQFSKLVLVGAAGVKPPSGEIFDIFQVVARNYLTHSVLDPDRAPEFSQICPEQPTEDQAELWEMAREGSSRLSWRPYMHYPALPQVLPRLKRLPTLLVWGRQDPIVPLSAGQLYHQSIPGSRLAVIDNCGHRPEIEKPQEFLRVVQEFLQEG